MTFNPYLNLRSFLGREPKIGVLLVHDTIDYAKVADASLSAYAARHGYSFIVGQAEPEDHGLGHPSWQKLYYLRKYLSHFDFLFYSDSDCVITNQKIRIETFIDQSFDLLVNKDWAEGHGHTSPWSAGVMLLQNTNKTAEYLRLAETFSQWRNKSPWDQAALHKAWPLIENLRLKILPRRRLQSVPKEVQPLAAEPWQNGDFIAHITALVAVPRRKALMQRYAMLCDL